MTPIDQDNELREQLQRINSLTESYAELEDRLVELITADRKRVALEARINERNKIALDNYRGQTVSESTNWQAKFEYFMDSNERRIAELKKGEKNV